MKYYDSCKASFEQEKNVCKSFSGKIINNDEEINNAHDMLLKYRSISENFAQLYKYELYTINKLIEENNKNYAKLVEKLKMNEESRIFFIKCNLEKFSKIHEEFTISSFEFLNV